MTPGTLATSGDDAGGCSLAGNGEGARCLEDYPGAKGAPGVFHTIINNVPPHETWIEPFAGSAMIAERKRAALSTVLVDLDRETCAGLVAKFRDPRARAAEQFGLGALGHHETQLGRFRVVVGDGVAWLDAHAGELTPRSVVYCDPPYLAAVRAVAGRRYYRNEFDRPDQHERLLAVLVRLAGAGVRCMVSGRRCALYAAALADWRRVDYLTGTHGGPVTESLWCSFGEPNELHDYRYLGRDFRERERIKRKLARWRARLAAMPILERRVIASALVGNGEEGL